MADDAVGEELRAVAAMARELLEWDQGLGAGGLPEPRELALPERVRPDAVDAVGEFESAAAPLARTIPDEPAPTHSRSRDVADVEEAARPLIMAAPVLDGATRAQHLSVLAGEAAVCEACKLHEGRTKSVFARGTPETELVFVGEGPGYHEDQAGEPFVGKAGQLLDKMIAAMGYASSEIYICNVVKCRPPDNRTPLPDEAKSCGGFLDGQLDAIRPKVIVALGRCAAERLGCLATDPRAWRGRWSAYRGVPVMPTYHPAFLLRSPDKKRPVWEDLQAVMKRLGKSPPGKS